MPDLAEHLDGRRHSVLLLGDGVAREAEAAAVAAKRNAEGVIAQAMEQKREIERLHKELLAEDAKVETKLAQVREFRDLLFASAPGALATRA
jgi:hypothetical protein